MTFPYNDRYWSNALAFLKQEIKSNELILAPYEFREALSSVVAYSQMTKADMNNGFQWIVIHKGMISEMNIAILEKIDNNEYFVSFANDVFVVLCDKPVANKVDTSSDHIKSLFNDLKITLKDNARNTSNIRDTTQNRDFSSLTIREICSLSRSQLESGSRSLCQTTYLGDSTILSRVLGKYMCYLEAKDASLTPHLCLNGYWESWLTQAIVSLIQPGFYCLDIGANCGYYSLIMADIVGKFGHVLSVEPNPRLSKLLKQSINVNGFDARTRVSQSAVSNTCGEIVSLVIPEGSFWGSATIYAELVSGIGENKFDVETITVDELTKDYPRVDFIKVDAEGAELAIWQGMQQTLEKNRNISIILEFSCLRNYDTKSFLEEIQSKGFSVKFIDDDSTPKSLSIEDCLREENRTYWDLLLQRSN